MAGAAISGMSHLVSEYLAAEDSSQVAVLRDVMKRGIELAGEQREDLANRIINALAAALDKNKRRPHQHG